MSRTDYYLYNDESILFVASPEALEPIREQGLSPESLATFVQKELILPYGVHGFRCLTLRLILDEPWTAEEDAEWCGCSVAALQVRDGRLALAASRLWLDAQAYDEPDPDSRVDVSIPPGRYQTELRVMAGSAFGPRTLYPPERIESLFRRTRPGQPLPAWLQDPSVLTLDFALRLTPASRGKLKPRRLDSKGMITPLGKKRGFTVAPRGIVLETVEGPLPVALPRDTRRKLQYRHLVFQNAGTRPLSPVAGAPVRLPVEKAVAAYRVAWCAGDSHPALRIEPGGPWSPRLPGIEEGVKAVWREGRLEIEFEGSLPYPCPDPFEQLARLGPCLRGLPPGSVLELMTWSNPDHESEAPQEEGVTRIRGPVHAGEWLIESTYPQLGGPALGRMIELGLKAEARNGFTVRSRKEGEAILKAAGRHDFLLTCAQARIRLEGKKLKLPEDQLDLTKYLAGKIFNYRFRKDIACEPVNEAFNLLALFADAAHHVTGEIVYTGRAKFGLASLEALEPDPRLETIQGFRAQLEALGFEPLGEVNNTKTGKSVYAGYARPEGCVYASIKHDGGSTPNLDLVTVFEDGHSLVTSDGGFNLYSSIWRLYARKVEGGADRKLEAHEASIRELSVLHGPVRPALPALPAYCACLDALVARA